MTAKTTPLHRRNDTILGVCQGIADDIGISADWFRVAFAAVFFFSPMIALGAYLGLGVVVALTRKFVPNVTEEKIATETVEAEEYRLAA